MDKSPLPLNITRSSFYNSIKKFIRDFRSGRSRPSINLRRNTFGRDFFKGKTVLIILSVLLIFIVGFHIHRYLQIEVAPYVDVEGIEHSPQIISDARDINVVFIGFDDTKNNYRFINMLAIVNLDYQTGELKLYSYNPNYLVNLGSAKFPLRSVFNLLTSKDEEKMIDLLAIIEKISAIRIDRYVAFNYSDLNTLIEKTGVTVIADKNYSIEGNSYAQDEAIGGSRLYDFIAKEAILTDDSLKRQNMFLKELLESLRDTYKLYRYFLDGKEFSDILRTDFTKDQFIRFVANLASSNAFIKTGFASQQLTLEDLTKSNLEEGIPASDILLDEDISKVFSSIAIIKEQAQIEIFNATNVSGVAYNLKRKFENIGITVIKTGNYTEKVEENRLYIPSKTPDNFINTIKAVRAILRDDVRIIFGDYKYNYSGDMILVIGKG
jgi:anionic cell wall polymer biosynthesis LytR-Cps2A-Psr (LCP) family protein